METTIPNGSSSDQSSIGNTPTGQQARGMFNQAKGAAQRSVGSLRGDLSSLKADLDSLLDRAPGLSDDELHQAHTELMARMSSMRHAARGLANAASRQVNRGIETTAEYVKSKPTQSLAMAVGTGLLLGLLFKRR